MITEDYVSFETAKLLKEKGFDELTYACFTTNGQDYYGYRAVGNDIMRPTLQMAMKWLRKKHEYIILFDISGWDTYDWYYIYKGNRYHYEEMTFEYNEIEEACEAAIKYCLENLI